MRPAGFRARCGAPLFYERARSSKMANIPSALFSDRTWREPYHGAVGQMADWTRRGHGALEGLTGGDVRAAPQGAPAQPADDNLFEP